MSFGGGSPALPPPPPPPPARDDPAIKAKKDAERMSAKQRQGRAATILAPDEEDQLGGAITQPRASSTLG